MLSEYIEERENLVSVILLIDGAVGPTSLDLQTVEWLHSLDRPITYVATKADKVKPSKSKKRRTELTEKLGVAKADVTWVSAEKEPEFPNSVRPSAPSWEHHDRTPAPAVRAHRPYEFARDLRRSRARGHEPATRRATLELITEAGINHIDTAAMYGDSEIRLHDFLQSHQTTCSWRRRPGAAPPTMPAPNSSARSNAWGSTPSI